MHRAAKTLKNEKPKILLKPRTITYVHVIDLFYGEEFPFIIITLRKLSSHYFNY
jgi:hypothetical protein